MTGGHAGISGWAFVEVQVGFGDCAEIEAAGEALRGEGVVQQGGELVIEADGEEEGEAEIEERRSREAQGSGAG